jgi:magnesium-transporting ATPase (P-type)
MKFNLKIWLICGLLCFVSQPANAVIEHISTFSFVQMDTATAPKKIKKDTKKTNFFGTNKAIGWLTALGFIIMSIGYISFLIAIIAVIGTSGQAGDGFIGLGLITMITGSTLLALGSLWWQIRIWLLRSKLKREGSSKDKTNWGLGFAISLLGLLLSILGILTFLTA